VRTRKSSSANFPLGSNSSCMIRVSKFISGKLNDIGKNQSVRRALGCCSVGQNHKTRGTHKIQNAPFQTLQWHPRPSPTVWIPSVQLSSPIWWMHAGKPSWDWHAVGNENLRPKDTPDLSLTRTAPLTIHRKSAFLSATYEPPDDIECQGSKMTPNNGSAFIRSPVLISV
jgi:hypothetical protein